MTFLDVIPHTLFRVLGAAGRLSAVMALERVFAQFFDDFSFPPKKTEVLEVIRQLLADPLHTAAPNNDEAEAVAGENALYNRLRDDGWFMEVVNRRVIEVHMPREAHAFLSALITLKEELKVNVSAEASLIDSGILAAYDDPVGKVMNIAGARRQAIQLRRSVDGVVTSLHRIEEAMMQSDGLADLLAKFMDRFVEKLLLENYRALKASAYNPMRFQRSIIANTERFINDDSQIARAAVALTEQGVAADIATAQAEILQDFSRIRDVFLHLGEKLDLIDHFSHKLERRIATTVRYQEAARTVKEEAIRNAIRLLFDRLDAGEVTTISPLAGLPVPYSTATLALPRKARDPVRPQMRQRKVVDPADIMRETMMDTYAAEMAVTPLIVAARLAALATSDRFTDLDTFEPQTARDIAVLYEARTFKELPGLELRKGPSHKQSRFVSGPSVLIRRAGERP